MMVVDKHPSLAPETIVTSTIKPLQHLSSIELHLKSSFFNQQVNWFVDTQDSQKFREVNKETPFRVGFIDGSNTNYEIWLDETSTLNRFSHVIISGQTGDQPVNSTSMPRINFHSGDALLKKDELTTCEYDNTECYIMQSIANVDEFDYSSGSIAGG